MVKKPDEEQKKVPRKHQREELYFAEEGLETNYLDRYDETIQALKTGKNLLPEDYVKHRPGETTAGFVVFRW